MLNRFFRRRMPYPAPRFRPSLEALDCRTLLSVTVQPFTTPVGALPGLKVVTTGASDTVTITDDPSGGQTTVVADGQSMTFAKQFTLFDVKLMSKQDTLTFDIASPETQRLASILVRLGKGENHFTFNPGLTGIVNHSDVNLNVLGSNGNDFVNLNFGDILESRVNVNANNLGGSKVPAAAMDVRDTITFGALRAGIRNASVDVHVSLGTGNNNLKFNYGSDLGHLAGAGVPGDFGPATFNVSITGSNRPQDVDNVTLFANGEVNTGSTLNFDDQLGAGNNTFKAVIDAAQFQIDDDGGAFISSAHSGGAAHFDILAGNGNDTISFQTINSSHTLELSGLLDIHMQGGSGKDKMVADFGGAGFTDDDPFELRATNRGFRLRIDGGTGDDIIKVNLANAATATFAWDVAIQGGSGVNDITFIGTNPTGGTPTFGPSGVVFIDAGPDAASVVDVFGDFPVEVLSSMK
jgi:hypothetical protein